MPPEIKNKLLRSDEYSVNDLLILIRKYLCYFYKYPFVLIILGYQILYQLSIFNLNVIFVRVMKILKIFLIFQMYFLFWI